MHVDPIWILLEIDARSREGWQLKLKRMKCADHCADHNHPYGRPATVSRKEITARQASSMVWQRSFSNVPFESMHSCADSFWTETFCTVVNIVSCSFEPALLTGPAEQDGTQGCGKERSE